MSQHHHRVCFSLLLRVSMPLLLALSLHRVAMALAATWHICSKKEVIKDVLSSEKITMHAASTGSPSSTSTSLLAFIIGCLVAALVILPALLSIRKTRHCCVYLFEGICRLRVDIFVRVHLYCTLFVSLFQIVFGCVLLHAEDLVVVLATNYFLAYFLVFWGELSLGLIFCGSLGLSRAWSRSTSSRAVPTS